LLGIAVGLLVVVAVSPARAYDLDYAVEDSRPFWNPDGVTLVGINGPWIIEGVPYTLCFTSFGEIWEGDQDVNAIMTAAASWETVLPGTEIAPPLPQSGCPQLPVLNITTASVVPPPEGCPAEAVGCASWVNYFVFNDDHPEREGSYSGSGSLIWINDDDYEFEYQGLVAVASHELGHIFGLHEAYLHDEEYSPFDPVQPGRRQHHGYA
jgi:hypothetical protein